MNWEIWGFRKHKIWNQVKQGERMTWGNQFPFCARASSPFQWRDFILRAEMTLYQNSHPPPRTPLSRHYPPNIWTPFRTSSQSPHAQFKVISSFISKRLIHFAVNYWSFRNKGSLSAILYWTLPAVTCAHRPEVVATSFIDLCLMVHWYSVLWLMVLVHWPPILNCMFGHITSVGIDLYN